MRVTTLRTSIAMECGRGHPPPTTAQIASHHQTVCNRGGEERNNTHPQSHCNMLLPPPPHACFHSNLHSHQQGVARREHEKALVEQIQRNEVLLEEMRHADDDDHRFQPLHRSEVVREGGGDRVEGKEKNEPRQNEWYRGRYKDRGRKWDDSANRDSWGHWDHRRSKGHDGDEAQPGGHPKHWDEDYSHGQYHSWDGWDYDGGDGRRRASRWCHLHQEGSQEVATAGDPSKNEGVRIWRRKLFDTVEGMFVLVAL